MYPLSAIVIGCDDELTASVRRELASCMVHIEAEFPETAHAIHALRREVHEKRLVLHHVDTHDELDALARMIAIFPGWPFVALVREELTTARGEDLISVMRAGVAQIVSYPIGTEDLRGALDRIAVQFVYSTRDSKVIAVAGVTGGCGATTLAINLANEVAHTHKVRTVLVDLSLKMGVIASHLDLEPETTILELLQDVRRVDNQLLRRSLIKVADNLDVLAGPQGLVGPSTTTPQDVLYLMDMMKQVADVIVLDVPCTYDDLYFEVLAGAGQMVLIGEQKLPSVRAMKMVREALGRTARGAEHLVINRFDPKHKGFGLDSLSKPLGVDTLLTVARDMAAMGAAQDTGRTLRAAAPQSQALADIVALTETLLSRTAQAPAKSGGLFRRLGRAFSSPQS